MKLLRCWNCGWDKQYTIALIAWHRRLDHLSYRYPRGFLLFFLNSLRYKGESLLLVKPTSLHPEHLYPFISS